MKSTIVCLLVLAVAAKAQFFGYGGYYPVFPAVVPPVAYHGVPAAAVPAVVPAYGYPSFTSNQYHAQDEMGQARFGYAHPGQAASNYRDGLGNQIGSYAYVNPEGKEVRVSYTADFRGFRVQSNNLPVAPVDNSVAPVQVPKTLRVAKTDFAKRQVYGYGAAPFA